MFNFTDDPTVVCLITRNNEPAYRNTILSLVHRCSANNLTLNVGKTEEVFVDCYTKYEVVPPLTINNTEVSASDHHIHFEIEGQNLHDQKVRKVTRDYSFSFLVANS